MPIVRIALLVLGACFVSAPAFAVDYTETANRAIKLLDASEDSRTICMLKKVQEDGTDDRFVADFYNIKQTAGGLPEGVSFETFLNGVSNRLREQLGKDSLYGDVSDDDLKSGVRTYDSVIRQIFHYLNANVHQAAPGEAHKELWNYILDHTKVSSSLYSCYSGTFIDER
jgi:hypothetical protein